MIIIIVSGKDEEQLGHFSAPSITFILVMMSTSLPFLQKSIFNLVSANQEEGWGLN